jgi:hypothetical protein
VPQGEVFDLTVDRTDYLRRQLTVERRLVLLPGREPSLARLKTAASHRTIPLSRLAIDA